MLKSWIPAGGVQYTNPASESRSHKRLTCCRSPAAGPSWQGFLFGAGAGWLVLPLRDTGMGTARAAWRTACGSADGQRMAGGMHAIPPNKRRSDKTFWLHACEICGRGLGACPPAMLRYMCAYASTHAGGQVPDLLRASWQQAMLAYVCPRCPMTLLTGRTTAHPLCASYMRPAKSLPVRVLRAPACAEHGCMLLFLYWRRVQQQYLRANPLSAYRPAHILHCCLIKSHE